MNDNNFRSELVRNAILGSIPSTEFLTLLPFLTRVRLVAGQIMSEPGELSEHAYFIERGIVSIQDIEAGGTHVQIACAGSEGIVNCECFLDPKLPVFASYICLIPSIALRLPVADLHRLIPSCPEFNSKCLSGILQFIAQLAETVASNARDTLIRRCIRLLLTIDERADGEALQVTQETLSSMLGVRRSAVAIAIASLQDEGLVQTNRGRMTILDRSGLQRQLPNRKPTLGPVFKGENGW